MSLLTVGLEKIKPFIAICILIMLILLYIGVRQEHKLSEEISQNCGWGEEDYRCFCEKSEAMEIKNKMGNNFSLEISDEVEYVQVAG